MKDVVCFIKFQEIKTVTDYPTLASLTEGRVQRRTTDTEKSLVYTTKDEEKIFQILWKTHHYQPT